MKVFDNPVYECLHLDPAYFGLTVQNVITVNETFNLLDVNNDGLLNDLQLRLWLQHVTDLSKAEATSIFELIDVYDLGFFDLEMFYFLLTILICRKDKQEKEYLNRHARSIYNLGETRNKGKMTESQFETVGKLFGFYRKSIKMFQKEFDVNRYKAIVFDDFKFYCLTCLELQNLLDGRELIKAYKDYRKRLVWGLKPVLVDYIRSNVEPTPRALIRAIRWIEKPHLRQGRGIRRLNCFQRLRKFLVRKTLREMEGVAQRRKNCCLTCIFVSMRCFVRSLNCLCSCCQCRQRSKEGDEPRESLAGEICEKLKSFFCCKCRCKRKSSSTSRKYKNTKKTKSRCCHKEKKKI